MKILFSQNTKVANSTKLIECKSEFTCEFYGTFNPLNPVVKLTGADEEQRSTTSYYKFCYAHIPYLSRYYFVNNWDFVNGLWICYLSEDVLASYRDDVLNADIYINRAQNGSYTEPDSLPMTSTMTRNSVTASGWTAVNQYIIGVYDGSQSTGATNSMGSIKYFTLNQTLMTNLQKNLWSVSLQDTGVNKANYIASCRIIPTWGNEAETTYKVNGQVVNCPWGDEANSQDIFFGTVNSNVSAYPVDPSTQRSHTFTLNVPKHPQATNGEWWLSRGEYATYSLYHPCMGTISIPADSLRGVSSISVTVSGDLITGSASVTVTAGGAIVGTGSINEYPTIALSSNTASLSTIAGSVAKGVIEDLAEGLSVGTVSTGPSIGGNNSSIAEWGKSLGEKFNAWGSQVWNNFTNNTNTGKAIASLTEGTTSSGVLQAIQNVGVSINGFKVGGVPEMSNAGAIDGVALLLNPFTLTAMFAGVRRAGNLYGRPVRTTTQLQYYSGMVQGTGAHVAPTNATSTEITAINNILGGVVFVE